ncbi:MAG TPA: preprotein translocase subunit SecE [Ktedonobacteraceae bacterium]
MANKMSEKKKSSGQGEMEEPKAQASEKELKSSRAAAREESKTQASEKELKSSRAATREESRAQASGKEQPGSRVTAREERPSKPASKPAKRDARSSQASSKKSGGFRNWPLVRFARESYRELRYKVTWPTFVEARNMTIIVILLSSIIGLLLGLLDQGLLQAFKAITGK